MTPIAIATMTTSSAEVVADLVDSSVAVPLVNRRHPAHARIREWVGDRRLGLAGHAAFETYAVLTRLPAPFRLQPATVSTLLQRAFPATVHLSEERSAALLVELPGHALAGGAVFDALVGAAAVEHGMRLITRDQRARSTYATLGVRVDFLSF